MSQTLLGGGSLPYTSVGDNKQEVARGKRASRVLAEH